MPSKKKQKREALDAKDMNATAPFWGSGARCALCKKGLHMNNTDKVCKMFEKCGHLFHTWCMDKLLTQCGELVRDEVSGEEKIYELQCEECGKVDVGTIVEVRTCFKSTKTTGREREARRGEKNSQIHKRILDADRDIQREIEARKKLEKENKKLVLEEQMEKTQVRYAQEEMEKVAEKVERAREHEAIVSKIKPFFDYWQEVTTIRQQQFHSKEGRKEGAKEIKLGTGKAIESFFNINHFMDSLHVGVADMEASAQADRDEYNALSKENSKLERERHAAQKKYEEAIRAGKAMDAKIAEREQLEAKLPGEVAKVRKELERAREKRRKLEEAINATKQDEDV